MVTQPLRSGRGEAANAGTAVAAATAGTDHAMPAATVLRETLGVDMFMFPPRRRMVLSCVNLTITNTLSSVPPQIQTDFALFGKWG